MKHCIESMNTELLIGSDTAGTGKQFLYNPWGSKYTVLSGGVKVASGREAEPLLDIYNDL